MRRLCWSIVLATSFALACGDDGEDEEKQYPAFTCDRTDWDCEATCTNLRALCADATCQVECSDLSDCATACAQVKAFPLPLFTAGFNCAAEHGSCEPYTACVSQCVGFGDGGSGGEGGGF